MMRCFNTGKTVIARFVLLFIYTAAMSGSIWGLNPETPIHGYYETEWRIRSGFFSDKILNVSQFNDGFLWVGADGGAVKHDGYRMKTLSFKAEFPGKGQVTYSFYSDSEGVILGTSQGLLRHRDGKLYRVPEIEGLPSSATIRFLEKDCYGDLWVGATGNGVYCFKGGKLESSAVRKVLDIVYPRTLQEDRAGNLWLSASKSGFFKGNAGNFQEIPLNFKAGKSLKPYVSVYQSIEDRNGNIWVGTNHGVIMMPNGDTARQINYDTRDGLSHETVWSVFQDSDGCIWFGTYNGLNRLKIDKDGNTRFEKHPDKIRVLSIFEDREKNVWISTYGDGLISLRDAIFNVYFRDQGVPVGLNILYRDPLDRVWLGSALGNLYRLTGGKFVKEISLGNTFGAQFIGITADRRGNLWLATMSAGLYYYNVERRQATRASFLDELNIEDITVLYLDSEENLWLGTLKGVYRKDKSGVRSYSRTNGVLTDDLVLDIARDPDGTTWIGTGRGLHVFKGEPGPGNREILFPEAGVKVIYRDSGGTLWVGTEYDGLRQLKNGKWNEFREEDGLVFGDILQVAEDDRNYLWTTSEHGIMRIGKVSLDRFARNEIKRIDATSFGFSDGLMALDCSISPKNAVMKSSDGSIWFSTSQGIATVLPGYVKSNKQPPPVIIEAVRFNGQAIAITRRKRTFKGEGQLQLSFTAPLFRSPEKLKFRYRLHGFEEQWRTSDAFGERTVDYENLSFGDYDFQVTACNAHGVWNPTGASFEFRLQPYFYQSILFKTLALLLTVIASFTGFIGMKRYLYMRKLKLKYKNSTLDPQKAETYLKKIFHFLEVEKIYRNEELTLTGFAEKLSIAPRYLSQIVNERINKNFRDFINGYRIEEAKSFLSGKKKNGFSVLEIAFEVGFNSKEAFNRAFKRYTGKTPTEFKKEKNSIS